VRVSNKKIQLLREQHDEVDCPKKRQKLRNRISALKSRINQRRKCKGYAHWLNIKDQRRTEFIHDILVPRLSQNPELMLEIMDEVNFKILGKRPNEIVRENENDDDIIQPTSKVNKPIKLWDMEKGQSATIVPTGDQIWQQF